MWGGSNEGSLCCNWPMTSSETLCNVQFHYGYYIIIRDLPKCCPFIEMCNFAPFTIISNKRSVDKHMTFLNQHDLFFIDSQ